MTIGHVEKARRKTQSYGAHSNREWMRGYLAANVNEGTRIGYDTPSVVVESSRRVGR